MATLYVENIPDSLYEALRDRAHQNRKSIAAEVLSLLEDNIVTAKELKRRREFFKSVKRMQARRPHTTQSFPTTEEMQREDRAR
jgi:plasmid stability protein